MVVEKDSFLPEFKPLLGARDLELEGKGFRAWKRHAAREYRSHRGRVRFSLFRERIGGLGRGGKSLCLEMLELPKSFLLERREKYPWKWRIASI